MTKPLDGIRVLDLSRLYPGPYCSMILADFGAEVLCIEDRRYASEPASPSVACSATSARVPRRSR